ncbi:MAG: hypothetical protein COB76_04130 [Alphaproteobacteria bacterium]|nr:MAG: hypothetical protein COB76_04130 [Alphaproteobacteria bacterium]
MSQFSAFTKSLIFHGIVIAVISSGLVFNSEPRKIVETPIEVSFVTEDDMKANKKPKPKPKKSPPKKIEPVKDDKPKPAPKALEKLKPKPAPKAEKTEEKKIERVTPKAEKKLKKKPKPKPKKPKKKKPKKVEKPAEKDTQAEFLSVLKNLADTRPKDTGRNGPSLTKSPTVDRITTGELSAFRSQLQGCWMLLPGATNADALAVNLTITVNKDRTVRDVTVSDKERYQSDTFFRAAADNAMRAIRHPDCTPLDLPRYKYDQWKTITLNFDPRTMF